MSLSKFPSELKRSEVQKNAATLLAPRLYAKGGIIGIGMPRRHMDSSRGSVSGCLISAHHTMPACDTCDGAPLLARRSSGAGGGKGFGNVKWSSCTGDPRAAKVCCSVIAVHTDDVDGRSASSSRNHNMRLEKVRTPALPAMERHISCPHEQVMGGNLEPEVVVHQKKDVLRHS